MKDKSTLYLLICVAACLSACSTGGGDPFAAQAGGSSGTGSGGGSSIGRGGATSVPEAGDLPDSALAYEAATPDSTIFGKLEPTNCDPADPCCLAFEWPMADPLPNILMNTGQYVTQDGALYQYIGTETIIWPQIGCAPKNPTQYHCTDGRWWKVMGLSCAAP